MTDGELLARLIGYGMPKADAPALAGRMLRKHGSLAPVLESLPADLVRAHGLSESAARLIHLIPELTRYAALERLRATEHVGTFLEAGAYLAQLYIGQSNECFYLLSLDAAGRLLDCSLVQEGTVDEAPFYLRRILDLATRAGAYAVVLSHNHPSGTPYPSRGDVECTMLALEALLPIDVLVLDHVLIADGQPQSMRRSDAMPEVLFTRQRPGDALIDNWYEEDNK
ncbi:RadC family protein [Bacillota bacterium Meth-B3]|nr:JAB domain-containing protein [Christensenellaceae bacterium]MEA5066717.1 JAB domain-containing protein [Eubacteriales bacterium]